MKPEEYVAFDAVGLAALTHRGEVTPLELTVGEDARLLALAAWFEREQPWEHRLSELRRRFLTAGGR